MLYYIHTLEYYTTVNRVNTSWWPPFIIQRVVSLGELSTCQQSPFGEWNLHWVLISLLLLCQVLPKNE